MKVFPERTTKGIGFAFIRIILVVYVLMGVLLYLRQDTYIFFPSTAPMEDCPDLLQATIIDSGGTQAYFIEATTSKIAVIYHGNADRACDSAYLLPLLAKEDYNVLFVEYTGYAGDIHVNPTVAQLLQDVEHIHHWIELKKFHEILIVGRSIGTGFASYHASLASPDKLLLISPFDSLSQNAREHYPIYPVGMMLKHDLDNISTASFAKRVLIIHGENDDVIPFRRGKALFDALPQKEKEFVSIPDIGHNNIFESPKSWKAVYEFFK